MWALYACRTNPLAANNYVTVIKYSKSTTLSCPEQVATTGVLKFAASGGPTTACSEDADASVVCAHHSAMSTRVAHAAHAFAAGAFPKYALRSAAVCAHHSAVSIRFADAAHALTVIAASENTRASIGGAI